MFDAVGCQRRGAKAVLTYYLSLGRRISWKSVLVEIKI